MSSTHTKKIELTITLDENNVPEDIQWFAEDSEVPHPQSVTASLLALWEPEKKTALAINLWTKDMLVGDMNILLYQTLRQLADTCENATHDKKSGQVLRKAAQEFAAHVKLLT